jgi:hypothetical protein
MGIRQVSAGPPAKARVYVARAVYDFADVGGAIGAITSPVVIPNRAVIIGGFVSVITTCTTAGADAGSMAISVEGANDIVSAITVVNGANAWDAGRQAIVPKRNTPESTSVKTTAARRVTFTIATQAFTAGKFVVYLEYVLDPAA